MTEQPSPTPRPTISDVLAWFGHDYDVDGRTEWHSLNCLYRKTWAMGGEDETGCVLARAHLADSATGPLPPDAAWLRELDEAASVAHDYIWSKKGVTQEQASEAIWKIHNDLRGVIATRERAE